MSQVLSVRERRIFECLTDTLLAPAPPLPPVDETDAAEAFTAWLAHFPAVARWGLRSLIVAIELGPRLRGRPWHALPPAERLDALERVRRLPNGALLLDALRAACGSSYYGDPNVSAALGYVRPGDR
jgi:hypothetical protein